MSIILDHIEKCKLLVSCICLYILALLNIIYSDQNTTDIIVENLRRLDDQITYRFLYEPKSNKTKQYVQLVIRELCEYNKYLLRLLNNLEINKSKVLVDYVYSVDMYFGPNFLDLSLKEIHLAEKLRFHDKRTRKAITYILNATRYLWDECKRAIPVTEPPIRNIIVTNGEPFRWV